MKIIDAFWEKRNLGMDVVEIILDSNDLDNFTEIENNIIKNCTDKYAVIKMPVGNLCALHKLQNMGFYFMEAAFVLSKDLTDYTIPMSFKNIMGKIKPVEIKKEEWQSVVDKIEDGMYSTDRIYLDPMLKKEMSGKRYCNWINDLFKKDNAFMYENILVDTNERIGYGVYTVDTVKNELYSLLTGIYPEYQGKGYGGAVINSPVTLAIEKGLMNFTTSISSNNIKVMKKHLRFGFELEQEQYVLRRYLTR